MTDPHMSRNLQVSQGPLLLDFDDNRLLVPLFGEHDRHLARIEQQLGVAVTPRGNRLSITGRADAQAAARDVLTELYARLQGGAQIEIGDVEGAIRMARARYEENQEQEAPVQIPPSASSSSNSSGNSSGSVESANPASINRESTTKAGADMQILGKHIANGPTSPAITGGRAAREAAERAAERAAASDARLPEGAVRTKKRVILPRSPTQGRYISELLKNELVFGLGPAGTGKTYLAVAVAVTMLLEGRVDRIILSRPAVEAGERLGFLPGDMREKIDPYLRPLYDALYDMLPPERVVKGLESGEIEVAPLAFMRGRTLANAFVILDEAQNTSPVQMKMLLTRLGENSRLVVTGDLSQIDLPLGVPSGLRDALDILDGVDGISFVRFNEADVVRHPLVTKVVRAYAQREQQLGLQRPDGSNGGRRRG